MLELAVEDEYLRYNPADKALMELKKAHNCDVQKKMALTAKEQELFEDYLHRTPRYMHWSPIFTVMLHI